MMTCHPLQLMPTLFPPVAYAAKYGGDAYECVTQRHQMLCFVRKLKDDLCLESGSAIRMCNPIVAKFLTQNGFTRNIPLQRELGFIFNIPDWGAVPSLMCGIPMVGHVVWVPEMLCRIKPALF